MYDDGLHPGMHTPMLRLTSLMFTRLLLRSYWVLALRKGRRDLRYRQVEDLGRGKGEGKA